LTNGFQNLKSAFAQKVRPGSALNRRFRSLKRFYVKPATLVDGFDARGTQFRYFDEA